ncbi:unnamed protein product [Polarella glacialis]|uniref:Uncharacterized protein n=1 Tax=Polarella glacialis TaxID=89957 RepID=A0A813I5F9_POLGL|nr:unnamed protein product [Polarella glacialis]CAE8630612.1 unnamed protein product [Polarella glacialis]CAE8645011.1 unnamed protein product [Polarella glacialis]
MGDPAADDLSLAAKLAPFVAENAVFKPPTYWKPWQGREPMLLILLTVGRVFGSSLRYRREWLSPDCREWALEFTAEVHGLKLTGVDLVRCDESGKICHFEVVMRPLKAVQALFQEMGRLVPEKMELWGISPTSKL